MNREIQLFTLSNGTVDITITDYGCTIVSIEVPDRFGNKANVVTGFKDVNRYLGDHPYMGSTVGRFAGRIANGKFTLDGKEFTLPLNAGGNHLHGGIHAFHRKFWELKKQEKDRIEFFYSSPDGEEGYPGKLDVHITFSLSPANELTIHYKAVTDAPTVVNLTNHSYFNLSGFTDPKILGHRLQIFADWYNEKNEQYISSGKLLPVEGTPYDFRKPKLIGTDIDQLQTDGGYDSNFVLNNKGQSLALAAILEDPVSGRVMEVITNQPGLQVFTSNWINGASEGWTDFPFDQYSAIALETQAFPDSPNHPHFPETTLRPGEVYDTTTIFRFLTR